MGEEACVTCIVCLPHPDLRRKGRFVRARARWSAAAQSVRRRGERGVKASDLVARANRSVERPARTDEHDESSLSVPRGASRDSSYPSDDALGRSRRPRFIAVPVTRVSRPGSTVAPAGRSVAGLSGAIARAYQADFRLRERVAPYESRAVRSIPADEGRVHLDEPRDIRIARYEIAVARGEKAVARPVVAYERSDAGVAPQQETRKPGASWSALTGKATDSRSGVK